MVLVVDDEEVVRTAVCDILELQEIDVIPAENGMKGVEIYREQNADIGVVLLDMKMPGMNGRDTYYALKALNPEVRVILSSGYSERVISQQFKMGEISSFLQKPYDFQTLVDTVEALM